MLPCVIHDAVVAIEENNKKEVAVRHCIPLQALSKRHTSAASVPARLLACTAPELLFDLGGSDYSPSQKRPVLNKRMPFALYCYYIWLSHCTASYIVIPIT
jgi:hypothetical protein